VNAFSTATVLSVSSRLCATHLGELGVSRYRGTLAATQLKATSIELFSAGDFAGAEASETLVLRDRHHGIYKRLVIRNNTLCVAPLYGDASDRPRYFELIAVRREFTTLRDRLLFDRVVAQEVSAAPVAGQ
jgi:nitrite reductase (NADH) large subunit